MIDQKIWDDQREFNALIRRLPQSEDELTAFVKEMVLNIHSESDELLRTTRWKNHRRNPNWMPNREHQLEEMIDLFKLWLTLVDTLQFSPQQVEEAYWRKSAVCRQRHAEEWVMRMDRPIAVVDIDNVLADYISGFCRWLGERAPFFAREADVLRERRAYLNAESTGMTPEEWQRFKHEFRVTGQKRSLPLMPGAREFLDRLHAAGFLVVLLTSRPIDRYPNIYSDTIWWLRQNGLRHDMVWWALDKAERISLSGGMKMVRFIVDDDPHFINQCTRVGLRAVWLSSPTFKEAPKPSPQLTVVERLADIDLSLYQTTGA